MAELFPTMNPPLPPQLHVKCHENSPMSCFSKKYSLDNTFMVISPQN